MNAKERKGFSSSLGLVLATAGSAVGLGNLWRFPYLAAKGGGLFLILYILLSLTFGFALMSTEIAIGRKTGVGPLEAYGRMDRRFSFLGWLSTLAPIPIFSYYCVIGGWVVRYAWRYGSIEHSRSPQGARLFLEDFLASPIAVLFCFLLFFACSAIIVWLGVEKGIEKTSRIAMPLLLVFMIGIAIYSLTLSHTDEDGIRRTAWEGVGIYLIPDLKSLTSKTFLSALTDATGQLFYSLGIAMGVMITFGSYAKKESDLPHAIHLIECFDTGIAILAGLVIIPSVYAFQGVEGLKQSGPELLFVSLPTVFEEMGKIGGAVGALFFLLVLLAALTSAVSLLETVTASLCDRFGCSRHAGILLASAVTLILGGAICMSYNLLPLSFKLPNGATGTLPVLLEYLSNTLLLPIVGLLTCILVGWVTLPSGILEELEIGCKKKSFFRKRIYSGMIRFVCPLLLTVIFLQALGLFS